MTGIAKFGFNYVSRKSGKECFSSNQILREIKLKKINKHHVRHFMIPYLTVIICGDGQSYIRNPCGCAVECEISPRAGDAAL